MNVSKMSYRMELPVLSYYPIVMIGSQGYRSVATVIWAFMLVEVS
jgi:hypothetical protein